MLVVLLIAMGLCLGSFVNALVWRLHEQEELKGKQGKKTKTRLQALSITRGRSMCPECGHGLSIKDLVPVLSWVWLRGKCRYCGKPIAWQYPVVELTAALLFVLSYVCWPMDLHGFGLAAFWFWLPLLTGFVALAVYDLRWYVLPNKIVFPLIGLALLELVVHVIWFDGGWVAVIASAWGVLIASGLFFVLFQISKGTWIGGGDVKLGVVLGILVGGPLASILLLFFASLLGTLASLPLIASGKAKRGTLIPFGPFLLTAASFMVLFGDRVVDWFNHAFMG